MADAFVDKVESLGIDTIELTHALGEIPFGRLDHRMTVIGRLTIGVTHPIEAFADFGQRFEPRDAIFVRGIYILAPVPKRGDVIEGACKF